MSAMTKRIAVLVAAVAAVGLVASTFSEDDRYHVLVPLENASGLKDGAAVRIGGVDRGTVQLRFGKNDQVLADLELDDSVGPIGTDARVAVVAVNFLGLKRVEITPGDARRHAAPSGWTVPADRVTTPTDLDQVLNVFDADTRTRLQILLTEAGEAVVGRRVDIRHLLHEFPLGLDQANAVLADLADDRRTLHELVTRSNRFVAEARTQRRSLNRLIEVVGDASQTVSARRARLRQTLARAPGTLRALQGFLVDLRASTSDLGPAARSISAAAPPLRDTLAEVDATRRAAGPTLAIATRVAPDLSRLALGATPVLRRALPTARAAGSMARALVPVTDTLDRSADNIVAIVENWSRAIQFRDQLGHVFRGEASVSPDLILSMVERLTERPDKRASRKRPKPPSAPLSERGATPAPKPDRLGDPAKKLLDDTVKNLPKELEGLLGGLTPKADDATPPAKSTTDALLDFLLGN